MAGWLYRLRQFRLAAAGRPSPAQRALAERTLPPSLLQLFLTLQPSEQAHACQVCASVLAAGFDAPALLQAALLHDIGKARHRLRLWERVLVVLGQAANPNWAAAWGPGAPRGLRRAFVIAAQHPQWGAEMAAAAGAAPEVVDLIARHADPPAAQATDEQAAMLRALQAADGEN